MDQAVDIVMSTVWSITNGNGNDTRIVHRFRLLIWRHRAQPWRSWWGRHNLSKEQNTMNTVQKPPKPQGSTLTARRCLWTTVSHYSFGTMEDSAMRKLHTPDHSGDVTRCGHKPMKMQFLWKFLKAPLQLVPQPMDWMDGEGAELLLLLLLLTRGTTRPRGNSFYLQLHVKFWGTFSQMSSSQTGSGRRLPASVWWDTFGGCSSSTHSYSNVSLFSIHGGFFLMRELGHTV